MEAEKVGGKKEIKEERESRNKIPRNHQGISLGYRVPVDHEFFSKAVSLAKKLLRKRAGTKTAAGTRLVAKVATNKRPKYFFPGGGERKL